MIDAIVALLRAVLAAVGQFALIDPAAAGSIATVAIVLVSVAVLALATAASAVPGCTRGSRAHPTRHSELRAPLAQSDPDAAGHVRRRGPGRAAAAA